MGRQPARAALDQAVADSLCQRLEEWSWPRPGELVTIAADWDGPALGGSDSFLQLLAGDRVVVTERNSDGLFYGTLEGKTESGWFGGAGCLATVTFTVPLGPVSMGEAEAPPSWEAEEAEADRMAADVESYITRHAVDDKAANALRDLEPELQMEIVSHDLSNCRNPSAVLLSRIDRCRRNAAAAEPPPPPSREDHFRSSHVAAPVSPVPSRRRSRTPRRDRSWSQGGHGGGNAVEDWIRSVGLDEKVAAEVRTLSEHEQHQVINTDLSNARNPSAVVTSRIQTVKSRENHRARVEEYLERHGVDEKAAARMHEISFELQQQIMASDMSNSRNPSAVLLSRIRQLEAGGGSGGGFMSGAGHHASYGSAPHGIGAGPIGSQMAPPPLAVRQPPPPPSHLHAMYASAHMAPPPQMQSPSMNKAVEEYIRQHDLDDGVAQELWSLTPDQQQQVMAPNITNARNPSAIVKTRIKNVKQGPPGGDVVKSAHAHSSGKGGGGGAYSSGGGGYGADTGGCWGADRGGSYGTGGGGNYGGCGGGASKSQVEAYLDRHGIDESASQKLRDLPPDAQYKIISQDMSNCRNPSAVLLSRIRQL